MAPRRAKSASHGHARTGTRRSMPLTRIRGAKTTKPLRASALPGLLASAEPSGLSPTGTATYYISGTGFSYSLKVASQKTLLGKGSAAGM